MLKSDHIATSLTSLRYLALFFPLFPFDMSVVENARGHAMRAALIALLLTVATQAGAECGNLCDKEWWKTATEADVQDVLDGGADVMARNKWGGTPLHYAISSSSTANIEALLGSGADVKARSTDGQTPLHYAGLSSTPVNIQVLLAAGADVMARDKGGDTPLHSFALGAISVSPRSHMFGSNLANIQALLAARADVMARNKNGSTPLHHAATNGPTLVIQALLDAGADVMARDKDGRTPLHHAAGCFWLFGGCKLGGIQALLTAGADAKAKNKEGKTPWDLAQENDGLKGTKGYWALNDAQYN